MNESGLKIIFNDDSVTEIIEDKIIKPISDLIKPLELSHPNYIKKLIEKQFTEDIQRNISYAISQIFQDSKFKNELMYNIRTRIDDITRQDIISIRDKLKEELEELNFKSFQDKLLKGIDNQIEALLLYQRESLKKISGSSLSPITNLYYISEEIEVDKKVDAETFVREKFESQGYDVRKNLENLNIPNLSEVRRIGKPDFMIFPKMYNDFDELKRINKIRDNMSLRSAAWDYWNTKIEDGCIRYSDLPFFVEVKTNGDGLKKEQLEWIKSNPQFKVIVFYLKQIIKGVNNNE